MYEKIKNDIAQEYYVKNYHNDGLGTFVIFIILIPLRPKPALPMEPETSRLMRFILMTSLRQYTLFRESFTKATLWMQNLFVR